MAENVFGLALDEQDSAKISFKWSDDIACDMDESDNPKLRNALDRLNYKAKMGVTCCVFEVVIQRFQGHVDVLDFAHRAKAAWASIISPLYCKSLEIDDDTFDDDIHDKDPVRGALIVATDLLAAANDSFKAGSVYLADDSSRLLFLARHVMPNKKDFSTWLAEMMRRTEKHHPNEVEFEDFYERETYDAVHEPPVYRAFFEPSFVPCDENAKKAITEFLESLAPENNPYLCAAEEMLAAGFQGTPYLY